jgi:putative SOS response-associated peptidase YedK
MCGRFYLTAIPAEIRKEFNVGQVPKLVPRYNIAPTQSSPIVISEGKASRRPIDRNRLSSPRGSGGDGILEISDNGVIGRLAANFRRRESGWSAAWVSAIPCRISRRNTSISACIVLSR